MTFEEVLNESVAMLQRQGRVSYRSVQRQFDLDDAYFADLKEALLYTYTDVVCDDGRGLAWTGELNTPLPNAHPETDGETRFHAMYRAVMWLLQREGRATYRELQHLFGLDYEVLAEIGEELRLKRIAMEEEGKVLVWIGDPQSNLTTTTVVPSQPITAESTVAPSSVISSLPPLTAPTNTPPNGPSAAPEDSPADSSPDAPVVTSEAARNALEAERRQLTVMFCDLVGSTDLSSKLDPEDLREVVRGYQETAAKAIDRYEGHIAQYLGDGLLIYFGFPVAHEDDAQRAVHTGLGIVEAMDTLNTRLADDYGIELAVRIGIHTGQVVVGEMGGGERQENLALGETPNIAARLEGLSSPNSVVISPVTARLVQRAFVLEELGPQELKGLSEPMVIVRVMGVVEPESSRPAMKGFGALVGRDEETGLLLRRWGRSKEGQGQVILLSGEAGIGKSSLVNGLQDHARQEGLTRVTLRCSPYHTSSALYPIIDSMQRTLEWQPNDSEDTKLTRLEQALEATNLALSEAAPLMASLLSLKLPEGRYPELTLSPQQLRQQTQDTLVAWLQETAEHQPVLAVWEDLHWADPSTLELLGLFVDQAPTASMLHLMTFRPEFEPPWPTRSHLTPITLNRLERSQVETLITRMADGKTLPAEVVEHIVAKTDGVPLYVEELTKMLLQSNLLQEEPDQYVLTGPLTTVAIPDTLQDSLMARLDQMNTAKEVAQLGAVLGREFAYEMLKAVTFQDEKTLQEGLAQLVSAELLYQRGRPPRARYIFKHALIQDVAYTSLLKSTRQQVHYQISQLLESGFPERVETQPELLAHHLIEAGQGEAAIGYLHQAGQRALGHSAYREAIAHLHKGLDLVTTLPDTLERHQRELSLQVELGPALMAITGYATPDVEQTYLRARELCEQLGDTPQLIQVLRGLMLHHINRGDMRTAHPFGEELLRLAQTEDEPTFLLIAHYLLGVVLFLRGESALAQPHLAQALTIHTSHEHRSLTWGNGIEVGMGLRSYLAWALWQLGCPDQSLQHSQETLRLAQESLHPHTMAQASVLAAFLYQHRGEASAVLKQVEAAITLTTEQGFSQWFARAMAPRGWALAMQKQVEGGIAAIRQG